MGFAVWAEGIDSQGSTKDDGHWRGVENIVNVTAWAVLAWKGPASHGGQD